MVSQHSPLPPPMTPTLEAMSGKLDHLITVVEVVADRVERLEDSQDRFIRFADSMRKIAMRLSSAGVAMATARALGVIAVPTRSLVALAAGAFGGTFAATILWQLLHARAALAGIVP